MKPRSLVPALVALALLLPAGEDHAAERRKFTVPTRKRPAPVELPAVEEPRITPELEERIVALFERDDCPAVGKAVPRRLLGRLSPLVEAVVAYCEQDQALAEAIFEEATARDPSRDTILVLHARYRWKRDVETALPLWAKVALVTKNPAMKRLAQQYLEGFEQSVDVGALASPWNFVASGLVAVSRETNPLGFAVSESEPHSVALNAQGSAVLIRNTSSGYLSGGLALINNRYLDAHAADLLEVDGDLPVALQVGAGEDIVFRPFVSYLTLGNQPFQLVSGLAVRGMALRDEHKQYVQGSIYRDWYFRSEYSPQAGTHFRFDYSWEFFPFPWFVNFGAFFEHVRAASDTLEAETLTITYSHNDFGVQAYAEHSFKSVVPSLAFRAFSRRDADLSVFTSSLDGSDVRKQRQDFLVESTVAATAPVARELSLYAWYSISRTFSNIDRNDYADRNIENQVLGLGLRFFLLR